MDTERPDEPDITGEAYEPVEVDVSTESYVAAEPVVASKGRLLLAILAGLAVGAFGIAVWTQLYYIRKVDYVGASVVTALLLGYVVREVSGRSGLLPPILSALIAAAVGVVGSVSVAAASVVLTEELAALDPQYWETFRNGMKEPWNVLEGQTVLRSVILVAAVVVGFISATPPKPKKLEAPPPPLETPDDPENG